MYNTKKDEAVENVFFGKIHRFKSLEGAGWSVVFANFRLFEGGVVEGESDP